MWDLVIIYPKPCSIYLRGTITLSPKEHMSTVSGQCLWLGVCGDKVAAMEILRELRIRFRLGGTRGLCRVLGGTYQGYTTNLVQGSRGLRLLRVLLKHCLGHEGT